MKINAKLVLAAVLIVPLFAAGSVLAVDDQNMDRPVASDEQKTTLQQRLMERKEAMKAKLQAAEAANLKTRCKVAQGKMAPYKLRAENLVSRRKSIHTAALSRLQELSPKLQAAGVDTAELDKHIATLKTKVDAYVEDLTAFHQAIDDVGKMDCVGDPEGFKASLEEARKYRKEVVTDGQDIRTFLTTTIRPLLLQIREDLKDKKTTQGGTQ